MAYKFNPFTGKLEEYGPVLTGTGTVAAAADGTAALPGISFANDLSVGIYRPGAEQLAFSTNSVGRLFIDASGNVGVGTSSPGDKLEVNGGGISSQTASGTAPYLLLNQAGIGAAKVSVPASQNALMFEVFNGAALQERARIDGSGRLLVGTSSGRNIGTVYQHRLQIETTQYAGLSIVNNTADTGPALLVLAKSRGTSVGSANLVQANDVLGSLTFAGADGTDIETPGASIEAYVDGTPGANDMPGRLVFSTTADGASSSTERMRIGQNGQISFFTSGNDTGSVAGINFYISGGAGRANWFNPAGVTRAVQYFYYSTTEVGSIAISSTATAYNTSSDYRLKENVTPVTDGITRLQQLKPSRFNFIADPAKTVDGFIAHEVQTIVPEAIAGEKDAVDDDGNPIYQGIDQSKLVPLLTAALQEAIAKIETLEAKVAALGTK